MADISSLPEHIDVLVVGVGFGGLAALHRLRKDHPGLTTLAIERAEGAGGVWRENDYPGAACDVPTSLYSLSFAPNPDWSHTYGRRHEIHNYLRSVAADYDDQIRYNCALTAACWDGAAQEWVVDTTQGQIRTRFLVAAPGALSEPGLPEVPGADEFTGTMFHSAKWDHTHDLRGRKVAIVGTGASAIQIVPEIVDTVEHLTVFQRTPAWVVPRLDRNIGPMERALYKRVPGVHRLVRKMVWAYREAYVLMMARNPKLLPIAKTLALAQLRVQVRDRALRKRLTPEYTIGCKRMLLTNKWFPALQRDNATVTGAITRLTANGAVDDQGREHEVNTVVFATGFTPTQPPIAKAVTGRDGRTLSEAWQGSPRAYRGVEVHGFPNLFFLYGPNTNLGHSSIVLMLEPQAYYMSKTIAEVIGSGHSTFEVTQAAQDAYNADLDPELERTVWNSGGCSSWYLDSTGRNSVMWPKFTSDFRRQMASFEAADHRFDDAIPAVADTVETTATDTDPERTLAQ
ncbi:flavin-containing monooxygenase [Gordonia alkanivorans]|uniref:Putative flavin-containing monooxygenase n=1 Tax=Gordonia alkanivorans NBRC 16433 TaxID=1027371 RepID=F9W114_9ACTN|nr:NAD(P)/FAD-dependent oxidoreductase [Gordonia alkanivorans]GAA14553.1 putative flavin-containing monooxygenase [Gordonia alkanivorans NBRC 16433]